MRLWYKVHKWVGVGVGLFLLMWVITGLLLEGEPARLKPAPNPDFTRATTAPVAAIAAAQATAPDFGAVKQVLLVNIAGRVAYVVQGAGPQPIFVDAAEGTVLAIDSGYVTSLAGELLPGHAVSGATIIRSYDRAYPYGSLPAWRVTLQDPEQTLLHVSLKDGSIVASTKSQRRGNFMHGLHTFGSLVAVGAPRRLVKLLFWGAALISLGVILSGYYLSLPKGWRFAGGRRD